MAMLEQLQAIAPDDLDRLERTAQAVATQIGPHEGRTLHRFARKVPNNAHIVTTGPCPGALAYLTHASHHGGQATIVAASTKNDDTDPPHPHILLINGEATYDHARTQLQTWWDHLPDGSLIAFLDAQEPGIRTLLEERIFVSPNIAHIGYIGRMVYARKASKTTPDQRRRNRRILRLWHAHIQLQRVKMPRPVRVAGREAMQWMQGDEPTDPEGGSA